MRPTAIISEVEGQAMPLHDWTDERGWDSVHPFWLAYLVEWIQPRLPERYKAFLGGVPALTVASGNGKPDVGVVTQDYWMNAVSLFKVGRSVVRAPSSEILE
jgi:hypothetical protein